MAAIDTGHSGPVPIRFVTTSGLAKGVGETAGRPGTAALDGSDETFWLSEGYPHASATYAVPYLEVDCAGQDVDHVLLRTWESGYIVYLSVKVAGVWQGTSTIPYSGDIGDSGAAIKYVHAASVNTELNRLSLKRTYKAERVRVTFRKLRKSPWGVTSPYRAGIRDLKVLGTVGDTTAPAPPTDETVPGVPGPITTYPTTPSRHPGNYCVDTETEILTKRGWLRWDEVQIGDESYTIDPATGLAGWETITDVFRKHRHTPMVAMEGRRHSSLSTPDHRWLVRKKRDGDRLAWTTTEKLQHQDLIPTAAPRADGPSTAKYSDEFVELVAWFWTEGSLSDRACVSQSKKANPEYASRIERCLHALYGPPGRIPAGNAGLEPGCPQWNERVNPAGTSIYRLGRLAKAELVAVAPDRVPTPDFLCSLTDEQVAMFVSTSIDADGHRRKDNGVEILSQKDERRIRAFEMACVLAGRTPNTTRMKDCWSTTIRKGNFVNVRASVGQSPRSLCIETVDYDDVIWCPTVKHHNWLARRRGSVYFTGNTDYSEIIKFCLLLSGWWLPPSMEPTEPTGDEEIPLAPTTYTPATANESFQVGVAGNADTEPVITVLETGTFQLTYNGPGSDEGQSVAVDTSVPAGTVINFALETAVAPGDIDVTDHLAASDFFELVPGLNDLTLEGTSRIQIDWQIAFVPGYHGTDGYPEVYGNIESTGAYAEEALPADMFDKRSILDAIEQIRQIVGYHAYVGEEGEFHFECVDDQTEALTQRGWVSEADLGADDMVLSLNPETGLSEWQPLVDIARYDVVDEPLVSIEGRIHSSLTTRNHRWWVHDAAKTRSHHWRTSETLVGASRIPICAERGDAPTEAAYSDEFVEIVAWWYTEGTITTDGLRGVISQSERANPTYVDRIRGCLEKLWGPPGPKKSGALWTEYRSAHEMRCWRLTRGVLAELEAVAPDRVPSPAFLSSLTAVQAEMFVETSIDADGDRWGVRGYSNFTQKDPRRVAAFEMAVVLAGHAFSTRRYDLPSPRDWIHNTKILKSTGVKPVGASYNANGATVVEQVPYTGRVWCPKLAANHVWLARRNGTVYFTGNSPNWFEPGNFDETGARVEFMPEFDEDRNLLDFKSKLSANSVRSEVIISTEDPTEGFETTKTTRYQFPAGKDLLRGISNPAMWVNGTFLSLTEQQRMAELISMHIFMSLRTGQAKILGNPLLSVGDQVRVFEQTTAEGGDIHFLRELSSQHNFVTGEYTMDATVNLLGNRGDWALRKDEANKPQPWRRYIVTDEFETWTRIVNRMNGRYYPEVFNAQRLQQLNAETLEASGWKLVKGMELVIG